MISNDALIRFMAASGKEGKARVARELGRSAGYLYSLAAKRGLSKKRKAHRNRGTRRIASHVLDRVVAIKLAGVDNRSKKNHDAVMPSGVAIEIAERRGIVEPGALSESTLNRYLASRDLDIPNLFAPTPAKKMRSKGPNHVHVVDATVCTQFYLKPGKEKLVKAYPNFDSFYKNKDKGSRKIWFYLLVDHATGAFFGRYYTAHGESTELLCRFLHEAWSRKHDQNKNPFCGLPEILLTDSGAGAKGKKMQNLFDSLGVDVLTHMPGNPRAKGSVERSIRLVQQHFECRTRLKPATTVEELNGWFDAWSAEYQSARGVRRAGSPGMTAPRMKLWRYNVDEESLRLPPPYEAFVQAMEISIERTLRDGYVSWKNHLYYCPVRSLRERFEKKTITILPSPFKADSEIAMVFAEKGAERIVLRDIRPVSTDKYGQVETSHVIGAGYRSEREPARIKAQRAAMKQDVAGIDPFTSTAKDVDYERLRIPIRVHEPEKSYVDRHAAFRVLTGTLGRSMTDLEKEYFGDLPDAIEETEIAKIAALFERGSSAVAGALKDRHASAG